MCSKKYNETLNDEVRWTRSKTDNFNGAQPTVTSIIVKRQNRHQSPSSSCSFVDNDDSAMQKSNCKNFISACNKKECLSSSLQHLLLRNINKNKSILYQFIVLYLVLNIICNNLLLTTLLPCVRADELMDAPGARGHYTPTWAVHIPGGDHVAQQVADDHGYVLLGKIIDEHYHFHHHAVSKRSISPSSHHQSHLDTDDRVRWSQQQRAKSRQKRDYVKPNRQSSLSSSRYTNLLNDPKWPLMWYLNRGSGLDMNVIPAWKEGITGRGVVVTILDDGLESDHPDLIANYDPKASYDVNSHDDDPTPHYDMTDSNRHGTRCAGEVAATANNSECAVGIAFGARVGGVRMLDGDVTDAVEARSLSLNPQHIDIYSASWGPDDDGKTVDGPGEMATRAFIEGVTKGRNGKGSIFIWASGNGGREHDNCNCDGYTNSIWTLSISSATEEGSVPWYSEMCSSTLATTYSSGGQGEKQVVTTDLHHSCTASHTGTSASAPLAAGIAALVLEANSNLTWRDLQHIVVRTAKPGNLKDPTWSKNGVGRRVSHSFGYGLMDAVAMVRLARTWKTVPDQQRCEINAPHLDKQIPPKSRLKLQLTVQHCKGVNFLEHVQAKISLTSQRRGDIQIYLTSPAGTKVTLLTSRSHDVSRAGFNNWPFMSVHTWGEAPHGHWQLEIYNEGRYMAQITQWELVFYGTENPPQPDDPPRYGFDKSGLDSDTYDGEMGQNVLEFEPGTAGQWRDIQNVDNNRIDVSQRTASNDLTGSACRSFSGDSKCIECAKDTFLFKDRCYSSCPDGSFMVPEISSAAQAPKKHKKEKSLSLRNAGEEESLSEMGDLKAELLTGATIQKLCDACHYSCQRCRGPSDNQCTECISDYLNITLDNETYCRPPAFEDPPPDVNFIFKLNTQELMLVGAFFGVIFFVIFFGAYFFFRNVCCSGFKEYTYNPLNDDDHEMGRQTINKSSAVAFKRELQRMESTSSDEDTEIYSARRYD